MKAIGSKIAAIVIAVVLVGLLVFSYVSASAQLYDFTVFIFAGDADQTTNRQLIEQWKERYVAAHRDEIGKDDINVGISFQSDTALYFSQVQRELASGKADDIFYVSPKYVKAFAMNDAVLDLSKYVDWTQYDPNGTWGPAIGAYAYDAANNSIGNTVMYDESTSRFVTVEGGNEVGVYALPKDFSSFGLAYNRKFFTEELRSAYTTTRDTNGAVYYIDANKRQGEAANIINIGRTVRYYPFNFYKYDNYNDAVEAGDPVAVGAQRTGGYDVTIMSWPGDTYDTGIEDNRATAYDESIGYVTYTYSEYSAMAWAVCYYAYMYDVAADGSHQLMTWLPNRNDSTQDDEVYGSDQFESTLYLTAWLLGNNVDIISEDYRSVMVPEEETATIDYGINSDKFKEAYAAFLAFGSDWNANSFFSGSGQTTVRGGYVMFLAGKCVFYGVGTWDLAGFNARSQEQLQVGIMPEPVSESYSPFAKVKNAEYQPQEYDNSADGTGPVTDPITKDGSRSDLWKEMMAVRQSQWKARLDTVGYGVNADVLTRYAGGEDAWQVKACADLCAFLTLDPEMQLAMTYSGSQLTTFVGQGVSYLQYQNDEIQSDIDVDLNYNFENMITPDGNHEGTLTVTQAELNKIKSNSTNSANEHIMALTTSLGYADADKIGVDQNRSRSDVWWFATGAAQCMFAENGTGGTVRQYVINNFPSLLPYLNEYFADSAMSSVSDIAYAFKCLNMVSLNYEDRNIQLRMVDGINGALDSCMYTYTSDWIEQFNANKGFALMTYEATRASGAWDRLVEGAVPSDLNQRRIDVDGSFPNQRVISGNFYTPSAFCDFVAVRAQNLLDEAVQREDELIGL